MERVIQPDAEKTASDHELLDRCRAGDEEAFDDLVRRHQQRAFNVAFQVLRDREDATEVAQDAFVRIYRSVDDFRGECEFTTWLHQIVVNLARNKHRWWKRRGRQSSVSLDSPVEIGGWRSADADGGERRCAGRGNGESRVCGTAQPTDGGIAAQTPRGAGAPQRREPELRADCRRAGLFHRHGQIADRAGAGSVAGKHAG